MPTAIEQPAAMNGLLIHQDSVPLREAEGGVIRVGSTRVPLDTVVRCYEDGVEPEDVVRSYDSLDLADVYAVIAYYLRHRDEVRSYLERREREAAALRTEIEAKHPPVTRAELLARRSRKQDHAPAGQ